MDSVTSKLFWFQFSLFLFFAGALLLPLLGHAQIGSGWVYDAQGNLCPPVTTNADEDGRTTIQVSLNSDSPEQTATVTIDKGNFANSSITLSWRGDTGQTQQTSGPIGERAYYTGRTITITPTISASESSTQIAPNIIERFTALLNDRRNPESLGFPVDAAIVVRDGAAHHLLNIFSDERRVQCIPVSAGFYTFEATNLTLVVQSVEALATYINYTRDVEIANSNLKAQVNATQETNTTLTTQVNECTASRAELTTQLSTATNDITNLSNELTFTSENNTQCINAYESLRNRYDDEKLKVNGLENDRARLVKVSDDAQSALKTIKKNTKQLIRRGLTAGSTWLKGLSKYVKSVRKNIKNTLSGAN